MAPDPPGPARTAMSGTALERLEALAGQLDIVTDRLSKVAGQARRTRHLTWGLVASFIVDVALTITVTILSVSALNQGAILQKSQITACTIVNQGRMDQLTLWGYVLRISATQKNSNPVQLQEFQAFIAKTFAPVNCQKVYG